MFNILDIYKEIDLSLNQFEGEIQEFLNNEYDLEEEISALSNLIVKLGFMIFRCRKLSWDILSESRNIENKEALKPTIDALRTELKNNLFAYNQTSISLQERLRSLRSILSLKQQNNFNNC